MGSVKSSVVVRIVVFLIMGIGGVQLILDAGLSRWRDGSDKVVLVYIASALHLSLVLMLVVKSGTLRADLVKLFGKGASQEGKHGTAVWLYVTLLIIGAYLMVLVVI